MRDIVNRIRDSCSPPPRQACGAASSTDHLLGITSVADHVAPVLASGFSRSATRGMDTASTGAGAAVTAAAIPSKTVVGGRAGGESGGVGDPLAALMGMLGGAGEEGDNSGGLLKGLLGGEDRARLDEAVTGGRAFFVFFNCARLRRELPVVSMWPCTVYGCFFVTRKLKGSILAVEPSTEEPFFCHIEILM